MLHDFNTFKVMGDLKAGIPTDIIATTFMDISKVCVQRDHKRRCNMSEVNGLYLLHKKKKKLHRMTLSMTHLVANTAWLGYCFSNTQ